MNYIDWITEKSYGKYAKNAAQEELNSFYGIAKSMRDSGMEHEVIAENLKTMYGATPEQVEMIQNEVLGKIADKMDEVNIFLGISKHIIAARSELSDKELEKFSTLRTYENIKEYLFLASKELDKLLNEI